MVVATLGWLPPQTQMLNCLQIACLITDGNISKVVEVGSRI